MGMMKSLFMELSCEEVFELNAWCDERREADIARRTRTWSRRKWPASPTRSLPRTPPLTCWSPPVDQEPCQVTPPRRGFFVIK